MTDIKIKGSQQHEKDFAELIGGTRVKGSGSQWHDKGDAANQHFELFAFRGDCKCTQGQSIAVSRAMLRKLMEDAGGERPALPLRFYKDERLNIEFDMVAILADDFGELLENSRQNAATKAELEALQARVNGAVIVNVPDHLPQDQLDEFARQLNTALASGEHPRLAEPGDLMDRGQLKAALRAAQDREADLEEKLAQVREERDDALKSHDPAPNTRLAGELAKANMDRAQLREERQQLIKDLATAVNLVQQQAGPAPVTVDQAPVDIPRTDSSSASGIGRDGWMVIQQIKLPGGQVRNVGTWWDSNGHSHSTIVNGVRIEPVGPHTERLVVNDRVVRAGDFYVAGKLRLRVGA